jgi:hypothetical protein
MGILIGPLTKLQLGFSLLTGGRGLLGTIAAFRTLGTVAGPAMANVRGSVLLSGIALNWEEFQLFSLRFALVCLPHSCLRRTFGIAD